MSTATAPVAAPATDREELLAPFPTLEAVRARLDSMGLDEASRAIAEPNDGTPPREALVAAARALQKAGHVDDAISVLAQGLSRRGAAWWACRAARFEPGGPAPAESGTLTYAEKWVRRPEQGIAYAAFEAATNGGVGNPAGCAAMAAFLAGDSLVPAHLPPLPPAGHLAGMLAAGGVKLAAVRREPIKADAHRAALMDIGFAIASGTDRWKEG